ncbi:MAG: 5'-nucleotidase C-terminal domain-containing protein [Pyrinomonadaceae bacterium]|nr:5'-nucleotidase C-terminal domain-containing protein [Pyrinomonadaceae bacterium]
MKRKIENRCLFLLALLLLCPPSFASYAQNARGRTSNRTRSQTAAPPNSTSPRDVNVRGTERAVDASVPDDPSVTSIVAPYRVKVAELNRVIGTLEGELLKRGIGGGSLGNFVVDAIRDQATKALGRPVLLAVSNTGGMRKNQIAAGELRASDVFELLPFENKIVALDLTGEQLLRFLKIVVAQRDAQSGARIIYRTGQDKTNELVSIKFVGANSETEIDPAATYTIVTIDYLVNRGGSYAVLQESKNVRPLGLTIREVVLNYIQAEAAAGRTIKGRLDGRFQFDRSTSAGGEDTKDQPQ